MGNDKSEYAHSEHIYKLYTSWHGHELRHFYRIRNADLELDLYLFRQFIYSSFWMCAHEVRRRIVEEDYGWDYFHLLRRNYPFAIALPKKLGGKTIIHLWLPKELPVNAKQEKSHAHYAKLRNQLDKILKSRLKMGWKIISSGPSIHRIFRIR